VAAAALFRRLWARDDYFALARVFDRCLFSRSSPARATAVRVLLSVFGITLLFLFCWLPCSDQVAVFAFGVKPDFEDHGTEAGPAPADRTFPTCPGAWPGTDNVTLIREGSSTVYLRLRKPRHSCDPAKFGFHRRV